MSLILGLHLASWGERYSGALALLNFIWRLLLCGHHTNLSPAPIQIHNRRISCFFCCKPWFSSCLSTSWLSNATAHFLLPYNALPNNLLSVVSPTLHELHLNLTTRPPSAVAVLLSKALTPLKTSSWFISAVCNANMISSWNETYKCAGASPHTSGFLLKSRLFKSWSAKYWSWTFFLWID